MDDKEVARRLDHSRPLTLTDILNVLRQGGLRSAPRTFWNYADLGLLPKGKRIPGRGNVLYFPADTVKRLRTIDFLNKEVGIPLNKLRRMRDWFQGQDFSRNVLWQNPTPLRLVAWFASALAETGLFGKQKLSQADLAVLKKIRDEFTQRLRAEGAEW